MPMLTYPAQLEVQMGLVATKPVFGVSDRARLKPVPSATETSKKIEKLLVVSLNMVLSKTRITRALIRLCGCAGWSAPLLFANPGRQVFSGRGQNCGLSKFSCSLQCTWMTIIDCRLFLTAYLKMCHWDILLNW